MHSPSIYNTESRWADVKRLVGIFRGVCARVNTYTQRELPLSKITHAHKHTNIRPHGETFFFFYVLPQTQRALSLTPTYPERSFSFKPLKGVSKCCQTKSALSREIRADPLNVLPRDLQPSIQQITRSVRHHINNHPGNEAGPEFMADKMRAGGGTLTSFSVGIIKEKKTKNLATVVYFDGASGGGKEQLVTRIRR